MTEQQLELCKENFTAIMIVEKGTTWIVDHRLQGFRYSMDIVLENAKLWRDGCRFILEGDRLQFRYRWRDLNGHLTETGLSVDEVRSEDLRTTITVRHLFRPNEEVEVPPYIKESGWITLKKTTHEHYEICGNVILQI